MSPPIAMKKHFLSLVLLLLTSKALLAGQQREFDFYVLSLSWSPEYCEAHPAERQCGRGYGLVLHGLWPQYQTGYPEFCSREPMKPKWVKEFSGLYPNEGLAFHEWKRHGSCSGLSPRDYLQFSQQLKQSFVEPGALKNLSKPLRITASQLNQEIVAANPGLSAQSISFSCTGAGRFLQEIYLCFDKTGDKGVACSADMQKRSRRSCGQADFLVRNVR